MVNILPINIFLIPTKWQTHYIAERNKSKFVVKLNCLTYLYRITISVMVGEDRARDEVDRVDGGEPDG